MFVNGEAEWQAELTRSTLKLTFFIFLVRLGEKSDRRWREGGREGGIGNIQRLTFFCLPQRSLTQETCTWAETRRRIAQRSRCSARQKESIALMPSLRGGEGNDYSLPPPCFLDTCESLCFFSSLLFFWPLWLVFISQKKKNYCMVQSHRIKIN